MAIASSDKILSETRFIRMIARPDETKPKNTAWYLEVCVSGMGIEFVASETMSYSEALRRITEFEEAMDAENKDFAAKKFLKFLSSIS